MTDWEFFEDHEPEDGIPGVRDAVVAHAWHVADELERQRRSGDIWAFTVELGDPDHPGPDIIVTTQMKPRLDKVVVTFSPSQLRHPSMAADDVIEVDVDSVGPTPPEGKGKAA